MIFKIKEFMKNKKLKQKDLQELFGVSQSYVSLITSGKVPITDERLEILRGVYGNDVDYYILEGEVAKIEDDYVRLVPLIPISAQGSSFNDFVASISEYDCEKIISPISDAEYAIEVTGDSMSPDYPNGSKVLIKQINEKAFIEWGRDYVLDTCNGMVVKRLAPSENKGFVKCISLNPNPIYAPFEVAMQNIYHIFSIKLCMLLK